MRGCLSTSTCIGSDEAEHLDHTGELPQPLGKESGDPALSSDAGRLILTDLDADGLALLFYSVAITPVSRSATPPTGWTRTRWIPATRAAI